MDSDVGSDGAQFVIQTSLLIVLRLIARKTMINMSYLISLVLLRQLGLLFVISRGSFLTRHLYLTRHFAPKIYSVRQFFNSFYTSKIALLLPIFHMNLVLKEYRKGRILWQVAGKVKVAGKERASRRSKLFLNYKAGLAQSHLGIQI